VKAVLVEGVSGVGVLRVTRRKWHKLARQYTDIRDIIACRRVTLEWLPNYVVFVKTLSKPNAEPRVSKGTEPLLPCGEEGG
jgi:hypothetical protein